MKATTPMRTIANRMRRADTAAMVGSISSRIPSHIFLGKVTAWTSQINRAVISSSKLAINAKMAAVRIPGRIRGRVICQGMLGCGIGTNAGIRCHTDDARSKNNAAAVVHQRNGIFACQEG